jgi:hypothetical protein
MLAMPEWKQFFHYNQGSGTIQRLPNKRCCLLNAMNCKLFGETC